MTQSLPTSLSSIRARQMKDVTGSSSRQHSRNNTCYQKKRSSLVGSGISKSHKTSSRRDSVKSSDGLKSFLSAQRQREALILSLHRQGILLEDEYSDDVKQYMLHMERDTMCSTQSMDQQPEVKWHMRPCLVDFLVEIHFTFRLRPETLYLTLNIVDRYVSRRIVYVKHYQLVGCAALWIAAKFEDAKERVPTLADLEAICREAYDDRAFIQMEWHLLETIDWKLGHPTAEAWLRLHCCDPSFGLEEDKVQHVARFLMEITLFYREFTAFTSSQLAAGALHLARFLCGKEQRVLDELEESLEVVQLLDDRLATRLDDLSETLVKKYSFAFYSKAATFVMQYYVDGSPRFERENFVTSPVTPPTRSSKSYRSIPSTPMSVMSATDSDVSDDMPKTPTSPAASPFPSSPSEDKENSSFSPAVNKLRLDSTPEQYLPHDFVVFGRSTLQNISIASPQVVVA